MGSDMEGWLTWRGRLLSLSFTHEKGEDLPCGLGLLVGETEGLESALLSRGEVRNRTKSGQSHRAEETGCIERQNRGSIDSL